MGERFLTVENHFPQPSSYLDQLRDVALRPRELRLVLDLQPDDKVEIVPQIVLIEHVILKRDALVVESAKKIISIFSYRNKGNSAQTRLSNASRVLYQNNYKIAQ